MAAHLLDEGEVSSLLAFIDEFEATPLPAPSASIPPSPSSSPNPSPASNNSGSSSDHAGVSTDELSSSAFLEGAAPRSDSRALGPQKKKKKRSPASSSTVLQRRKRAEIAALRELAMELEAQIATLKRRHSDAKERPVLGARRKPASAHSMWRELAALQARERQRAEATNRKLKTVLSSQQQVNDELQTLVHKRSVLQGLEELLEPTPTYRRPVLLDCAPSVLGELEKMVEALYIGMDRRSPLALPPPVSSTTDVLYTKSHGHTIQMVTTTPLSCSMEEAAEMLWRNMTIKREVPDKTYTFSCRPDNASLEKNFVLLIRDSSSTFHVNGLQFMRKFVEAERVVIVRTDLMLLPTSGLRFRDRTWTTVSRVASSLGESSVVEARYQLNAETDDGLTAAPDDLSYVQQYLLQRLSSNSRAYEQLLQSTLLAEESRRRAFQCEY